MSWKPTIATANRHVCIGSLIRCFGSSENRGGATCVAAPVLRIQGEDSKFVALAIVNDPKRVREALVQYMGMYPQDAAYHKLG